MNIRAKIRVPLTIPEFSHTVRLGNILSPNKTMDVKTVRDEYARVTEIARSLGILDELERVHQGPLNELFKPLKQQMADLLYKLPGRKGPPIVPDDMMETVLLFLAKCNELVAALYQYRAEQDSQSALCASQAATRRTKP